MNQTVVDNEVSSAEVPAALKARYLGTGFVMGVFVGPAVLGIVQRLLDVKEAIGEQRDSLKATFARRAQNGHGHAHDHDHDHDHARVDPKRDLFS